MVRGLSAVPWVLALAACAWGAWGTWRADTELKARVQAEGQRDRANENAATAEKNRLIERDFRVEQDRRNALLTTQLQAAQDDARAAALAGDRLRAALGRLRAQSAATPGVAASHPAPVSPGDVADPTGPVLAELLGRCSERREELARYADRLRVAAEACVGDYRAAERLTN